MDSKKVVFVSGVSGQDGSWMVEYLLKNTPHDIYGGVRMLSTANHVNIAHIKDERFKLVNFDLLDKHCIDKVVKDIKPHYFINFAGQSVPAVSLDIPIQTMEANATSMISVLEAIRTHAPYCRFYNAGTSEEFGDIIEVPQNEQHPLRPCNIYGASKVAARNIIKVYRQSYGLYAIQGWLFNHEGTRRGEQYVTRKITKSVARILHSIVAKNWEFEPLELGALDMKRDWSDAEDFMDGIWRMLNQEKHRELPCSAVADMELSRKYFARSLKEYILSSNETHTIREFVELAFDAVGVEGLWYQNPLGNPSPANEEFILARNGLATKRKIVLVKVNPKLFRLNEAKQVLGDSTLARKELGWNPKSTFIDLVSKMVTYDVNNYE
jgi:GDPmannose 4,6-dehydratase